MTKVTLSKCWNGEVVTTYPECPYADTNVAPDNFKQNKYKCTHPKSYWKWCDCEHMEPVDCPFGRNEYE